MVFQSRYRKRARFIVIALLLIVLGAVIVSQWMVRSTRAAVFTAPEKLPERDVALVLGTGKFVRGSDGQINTHFVNRMQAAADLYHSGKVRHLLLSGDNHIAGYDEPTDMADALVKLNVPRSAMTLDYAGFRTLDSVVRAKAVFGQQQVTIVTDDFHANRAVFLARHAGLDAVAFCSNMVPIRYSAKTRLREVVARLKAVADVFVLHTGPHFLGNPVAIKIVESQ